MRALCVLLTVFAVLGTAGEKGTPEEASLRGRIRENWYPIPDVCVYPLPAPEERYPSRPPLLWIEILSQGDRMIDVWDKAKELVQYGVPYVWIVNPNTLESELWTAEGLAPVHEKTLRLADSPIVVPLPHVMEE